MAIRNAEERLRALVNDPEFQIASGGEFIPLTRPVLARPVSDLQGTARAALYHRPEVVQGFYQLRAAGLCRDIQRNEMKPQLNAIAEFRQAGNDEGRQLGDPVHDQLASNGGYLVGLSYDQALGNNTARARLLRREYELRQQTNQLRNNIDQVLLESVVSYRELLTAYRDMQGRWAAVQASRAEVNELKERLDVDTDDRNTVGNQLQLILDAIERRQVAEEAFLVSIVAYNTAFASVERSKGTLLDAYDIQIQREREESWRRHRIVLESLHAGFSSAEQDAAPITLSDDSAKWNRHRKALEELKANRGQ